MSVLAFQVGPGLHALAALALPVEVRNASRQLMARTVSTRPVELRPGSYFVTAKLPHGEELIGQVKLPAGRDETIVLRARSGPRPAERLAPATYPPASGTEATQADYLVDPRRGSHANLRTHPIRLRLFAGNVLGGPLREIAPSLGEPVSAGGVHRMGLAWGPDDVPGPRVLQLARPGERSLNVMLPIWASRARRAAAHRSCPVDVGRSPDGRLTVEPHPSSAGAEMLVRYLAGGHLQEAATVAAFDGVPSAGQPRARSGDPIGAAVGAYALLRLGELARLDLWIAWLRVRYPRLPDGVALRGEYLARIGRHREALRVFLLLGRRGLPLLTAGFGFALDRIGLYTRAAGSAFTPRERRSAEQLLEHLRRFAPHVDVRATLLTYSGLDPQAPSQAPLGESVASLGGLDLARFLGWVSGSP